MERKQLFFMKLEQKHTAFEELKRKLSNLRNWNDNCNFTKLKRKPSNFKKLERKPLNFMKLERNLTKLERFIFYT